VALYVVIVAGTLAGAALQSATGLGLGLVIAPPLFAALDPQEAVTVVLIVSAAVNVMTLGRRHVPRAIRWHGVLVVSAWALPGLVAGVAIGAHVSKATLQIALGVAICIAAAVRFRPAHPHLGGRRRGPVRAATGFLAGLLTTALSTNGPVLALWLDAEGATPDELRDSLAALFLALGVPGAVLLAASNGFGGRAALLAVALLPVVAVGHVLGLRARLRFRSTALRRATLAVVVAAGVASIAAGVV
jgi:uncharacterized membrane protein YfcA